MGLNKYRLEKEDPIEILDVTILPYARANAPPGGAAKDRDEIKVEKALDAITRCAETGEGNLLELSVEAGRLRATLGEISTACEKVAGRYKAVIRSISGIYSSESMDDKDFNEARRLCDKFAKLDGRQPRIMIAKMGQDGHDRGAKVVATGYADIGFDVDIGAAIPNPSEAARQAVENDVHVLGVSSLAAGHKTLVPQVIEESEELNREDIMVICSGVIPHKTTSSCTITGWPPYLAPEPRSLGREADLGNTAGKV